MVMGRVLCSQSLYEHHERPDGAVAQDGQRPNTHGDRSGKTPVGQLQRCSPTSSGSPAVEHWRRRRRNRDASLYCGGRGIGAFVARAPCDRGGYAGSVVRLRADWFGASVVSSRRCSKSDLGRNGGK